MIQYKVCLNNGIEAFGIDQKTITANEVLETCDEKALAREIAHENPLIPEQVAKAVLENFCKAAANLMSMGFAIHLKNGNDVAMRIHPDIHVKGGNINLARAQQLDSTVTELTVENASELVAKAGVTLRAKAECEPKFTDLLLSIGASISRKGVVERAKVMRVNGTTENGSGGSNSGTSETPGTNTGGSPSPDSPEGEGTDPSGGTGGDTGGDPSTGGSGDGGGDNGGGGGNPGSDMD